LKNKQCNIVFQEKYWKNVSREAIDLVLALTEIDPLRRPTATEALKHNWFRVHHQDRSPQNRTVSPNAEIPVVSPNQTLSRAFMQRINERREPQTLPNYFQQLVGPRVQEERQILPPLKVNQNALKIPAPKPAHRLLIDLRDSDVTLSSRQEAARISSKSPINRPLNLATPITPVSHQRDFSVAADRLRAEI
jgi:serine/threonine protein kinase